MNKLVIVRHCKYKYDKYNEPSEEGQSETILLAEKLKGISECSGDFLIISSSEPVAKATSEIIAGIITPSRAEPVFVDWLYRRFATSEEIEEIVNLLNQINENISVVIAVSHGGFSEQLAIGFLMKFLGINISIDEKDRMLANELGYSEAIIIDCIAKTFEYMRQT